MSDFYFVLYGFSFLYAAVVLVSFCFLSKRPLQRRIRNAGLPEPLYLQVLWGGFITYAMVIALPKSFSLKVSIINAKTVLMHSTKKDFWLASLCLTWFIPFTVTYLLEIMFPEL
ncbi:MAG: hypothetical protein ACI4NJ_02955 [Cellvibrio sp.]